MLMAEIFTLIVRYIETALQRISLAKNWEMWVSANSLDNSLSF